MTIEEVNNRILMLETAAFKNESVGNARGINIEIPAQEKRIITFENFHFLSNTFIRNVEFTGVISFLNCTFSGLLSLENMIVNDDGDEPDNPSVTFAGCDFNGKSVVIVNSHFAAEINFSLSKNISRLSVKKSKFDKLCSFIDTNIVAGIEMDSNEFQAFEIYKLEVVTTLVADCSFKSILLHNSKFDGIFSLKSSAIEGEFYITDCFFHSDFNIRGLVNCGENSKLHINQSSFDKPATINYSDISGESKVNDISDESKVDGFRQLSIGSIVSNNVFEIIGNPDAMHVNVVRNIKVAPTNRFQGQLKIEHLSIGTLYVTGENYTGNIVLNNLMIGVKFLMYKFLNYSNFQLINIDTRVGAYDLSFEVVESHLDKVQFINCRIDKFKDYLIYNSNLSQIRSSNTKWFDFKKLFKKAKEDIFFSLPHNKLNAKISISKFDFIANMQETFRQLKHAMNNQGDKFNALNFRTYEHSAAYEMMKLDPSATCNDKLILFFGKINNYGLSWSKPLLWWGVVNLIMSILLITVTHKAGYCHFSSFIYHNNIFVQLLNPVHNLDNVFSNSCFSIGNAAYWLDYISRIVSGFFIFEIISAFRKFIKN
ncbi:MAG: hypothetical protein JST26_01675 [Bacteroidetes bacterium]|nr:hypothetical protein [Bacteroidota bacterium]